jgi:aspartate racemase
MKTLGLIGGMTWQSTVTYYATINDIVQKCRGGMSSAHILLHSVDFSEIEKLQIEGRWKDGGEILGAAAAGLVREGAEVIALCCNTMHVVSDMVEARAGRPLLHIADPLGAAIVAAGLKRVTLLGTPYTMQMPGVLRTRLEKNYGLEILLPNDGDRAITDDLLTAFQRGGAADLPDSEISRGRDLMARLTDEGAQGIILGCTELPLILKQEDSPVPLFDTATLHAEALAAAALA